jgi:hypothetical protein
VATAIHGRLRAALVVAATGLLSAAALTTTTAAAASHTTSAPRANELAGCPNHVHGSAHVSRFAGVVHPQGRKASCQSQPGGDQAIGTPPLLYHGGPVMSTQSTGALVVTPIYWNPAGHPIDSAYKNVVNTYLADVAAASGSHTNVFSTATEYYGTNGSIRYQIRVGNAISDTGALPKDGCKLVGQDRRGIYGDGSGYDACLDDDQIIAETDRVVSANNLTRDFAHIYVMFLPKHVESCFYAGSTTTANNFCTINYQPSAAYCAYHSFAPSGAVYANMPFPVYHSAVGYTCGTEKDFGEIQTPNGNADADVEVSPTSHEIMEAITDPDTVTGWYDSSTYENGDECAYVFGATSGTPNQLYNQTINRHHYLTQEEFSNADFFKTGGGCLQHE